MDSNKRGHKRGHDEAEHEVIEGEKEVEEEEEEEEEEENGEDEEEGNQKAVDVSTDKATAIAILAAKARLRPVNYRDRVFLLPEDLRISEMKEARILDLPNARAGKSKYLVVSPGEKAADRILEIQRLSHEVACWFHGDNTIEDGNIYLTNDVDPMFILLPLLEKNQKKNETHSGYFCSFDQILSEDLELSASYFYLRSAAKTALPVVCDSPELEEGVGDEKFYRLNEAKVLAWLQLKFEALVAHLRSADPAISRSAAIASNLIKKDEVPTEVDISRTALGLLSEYISASWIDKLKGSVGLELSKEDDKEQVISPYFRSPKEKNTDGASKETPTKSKPLAQKRLEAVDKKGISPITSYFKKK